VAKPSIMRHSAPVVDLTQVVGDIAAEIKPMFLPPKGVAYSLRALQIGAEYAADIQNLMVRFGRYVTRPGTIDIGDEAEENLVYAYEFIDAAGTRYFYRWLPDKVQVWDGVTWEDVIGITLTGTIENKISVTSFGGKLLFCNGIDPIQEITTPDTGAELTGSPVCSHITTFAGRVVASDIVSEPYRIQWSVKNDHTDWAGLGSGYEDLFSTPGGAIDSQAGVYPVTEVLALALRSDSVWSMSETGIFDTPFRFGRIMPAAGCRARHSVAQVPDGIVFLGQDNIYQITLPNLKPEPVGDLVKDQLLNAVETPHGCFGVYSPRFDEYRLFIPGPTTNTLVYRYNRAGGQWTSDKYPFQITSISGGRNESKIPIDLLTGTIDGLSGFIDALGVNTGIPSILLTTGTWVVAEDMNESNSTTRDTDGAGGRIANGFLIRTGYVFANVSLKKTQIIEIQLEYESGRDTSLIFEYSDDNGNTWSAYSTVTASQTVGPRILAVRRTIERKNIVLRLRTTDTGIFRLFAMYVRTVSGAMVAP
jgi:hypothetical protein